MKCPTVFVPFLAVLIASVASRPVKRDVDPSLVPQFGWQSGVNPTGEISFYYIAAYNGVHVYHRFVQVPGIVMAL